MPRKPGPVRGHAVGAGIARIMVRTWLWSALVYSATLTSHHSLPVPLRTGLLAPTRTTPWLLTTATGAEKTTQGTVHTMTTRPGRSLLIQ